jgi:hypothetical protein
LPTNLAIYNQVCTNNYKYIKENRSDDVVKYFQSELENARQKLRQKTNFLSLMNVLILLTTTNRVRPAVVKEDMEVLFRSKAELAGFKLQQND